MSAVVRRCVRVVGWLVLLGCSAAVAVGAVQGVRLMPVLTGSMTPYAPAGSLVLTVPIAGADVAVGDAVAFRPPAPYVVSGGRPIFHRVAALDAQDGQEFMITKGDANPGADPWRVATAGETFGRGVLVVPHLGKLFAGGTPSVLALVLGVGALLSAIGSLRSRGARQPRGGRSIRTVHRVPQPHTLRVGMHVPAAEWQAVDGPARARARTRAALAEGLASQGLVLTAPPVAEIEDDGVGGVRMHVQASAVPA